MKKAGFTLIEVMVVVFILLIISTFGLSGVNTIKKIKEFIQLESVVYEVRGILSYGKLDSRKFNRENLLCIDEIEGTIKLINDNSKTQELGEVKMPKGITIKGNFEREGKPYERIQINNKGFITTSGTITMKNLKGNRYQVRIAVGNDTITVYNIN